MLNRDGDAYLQIWSLDTSKIENQSFVDWDKQKQIEKGSVNIWKSIFNCSFSS